MDAIELSDFIKSTLVDIARGVTEANAAVKASGEHGDDYFVLRSSKRGDGKAPGIAFDIAVSASRNQKDKAGFMVALATIGGGANTEKGSSGEMVHRIKFEVSLDYDYR
jgi:hypothetical protein